jgi:hypothetical protein
MTTDKDIAAINSIRKIVLEFVEDWRIGEPLDALARELTALADKLRTEVGQADRDQVLAELRTTRFRPTTWR